MVKRWKTRSMNPDLISPARLKQWTNMSYCNHVRVKKVTVYVLVEKHYMTIFQGTLQYNDSALRY